MPVTDFTSNPDTRTITITAEFDAPVERVWALYADPRQLERVFGPPSHPATFVQHDLTVGAETRYYMTSPEGEKYPGVWTITAVDEPHSFSFEDAFADEQFRVNADLPVCMSTYSFEPQGERTRAVFVSTFASAEALQQVIDMGVEEGSISAINQIDGVLAA
ncbi:SRPBCC family protein [Aestuariimicrobium kwangyangense]|uniref:SRPBCC family protein n=1 Tax=Aestuariimicrobium kwangyangense TaxID=396389 RepID=UPI0003B3CF51|nr:SRPBCC domain-containing protein [Aestuariimicrobium kwangyangense]